MAISKEHIENERATHQEKLTALNNDLNKLNNEIAQVRSNINALTGAIQQCNRVLEELDSKEEKNEEV